MSRIGRIPVPVPSGVDVTIDGRVVTVKGPKGELTHTVAAPIAVDRDDAGALVIAVSVAAVVLGVIFPVFGLSVLVVLAVDAVLTRRRRSREHHADHVPSTTQPGDPAEAPAGALVEANNPATEDKEHV